MVPNLVKNVDRRPNYGPKTKFKMAAAAMLNLFLVAIFNTRRLYTVALNYRAKFRSNISIHD